jgi:putative DNA modification/repair radical SAM protein
LDFYKRNCIEGLFLSSGIIRNPDYTMEELVRVARTLREDHQFRGYIHLKTIPDASQELVEEAGRYADRVSVNVELPTNAGLKELAPEKRGQSIRRTMAGMRLRIEAAQADKQRQRFAPAGQSTQMIVGADGADDRTILTASAALYASYGLRRVYYSAFSPIPDASTKLPLTAPPLRREHRLYQADWLYRFYGFSIDDLLPEHGRQMLALDIDPKLAWALQNRALFPIDLNRGSREELLRVPGLGVRSVDRILKLRRHRAIRLEEVAALGVSLPKIAAFVVARGAGGTATSRALLDRLDLGARLAPHQLSFFDHV